MTRTPIIIKSGAGSALNHQLNPFVSLPLVARKHGSRRQPPRKAIAPHQECKCSNQRKNKMYNRQHNANLILKCYSPNSCFAQKKAVIHHLYCHTWNHAGCCVRLPQLTNQDQTSVKK
jgi:hypothetical protein